MYVWADMIDWRFIQTAGLKREWPSVRFISLSWLVFELHVASLIRTIVSCRLQILSFSYIFYLLRCPYVFFVPLMVLPWFCNQAVSAEPDKWRGVWVGGSWGTYVVVLFWYYLRSPHFSWAPAACLSSFCVIWFRGCICSCPPSGTVRGRGSLACQITGCAKRHSSVRKG